MFTNKLKFNPDKTKFILIGSHKIRSHLSTRVHVRDLSEFVSFKTFLLANACVSSRLDYCNSLFISLTDFELKRSQLVQISLCRVVTHSSKFSHITLNLTMVDFVDFICFTLSSTARVILRWVVYRWRKPVHTAL